jgi:hypothetical protein
MKPVKLIYTAFILVLGCCLLVSCGKDELTEPATVVCTFQVESQIPLGGALVFERIDLNLSRLDISGRRSGENDMFFSRKFDKLSGNFQLLQTEPSSTRLQIPQGTYESLVFYLTPNEEDYEFEYGSTGEDDETGDLAEYLLNAKPGVLVVARYTNGSVSFPVIISLNDDIRRFALEVSQAGLSTVVLRKEIVSQATVLIDPAYWFTAITTTMFENAVTFPLNGEDAVVISEDYNENLYNLIAGRLEGSASVTFEAL